MDISFPHFTQMVANYKQCSVHFFHLETYFRDHLITIYKNVFLSLFFFLQLHSFILPIPYWWDMGWGVKLKLNSLEFTYKVG